MKNKKMVLWIALIVMAIIPVYAQQYNAESDFQIEKDQNVKGGVIITKYIGSKKEVRIPPSIQNSPVTGIGDKSFCFNKNITSVIIPNSVTKILDGNDYENTGAFKACGLTSIIIPDSVTSLGDYAFSGCISLTSVTIGNGVKRIGNEAFFGCTKLTNVTIGNGVTSIEDGAFGFCTSLNSITIPDSVTSIGDGAFDTDRDGLTSVTFQGTIVSGNFGGKDNWSQQPFPGDLREKYLVGGRGTYTRASNGKTWTKQSGTAGNTTQSTTAQQYNAESDFRIDWDKNAKDSVIITKYVGTKKEVNIPPSIQNYTVTGIGTDAFNRNDNITRVTVPNGVTSIGLGAFEYCRLLTSVTIGNGVTSIEKWAFRGCEKLTSVTIPNGVVSIGVGAFRGCGSLTSIVIPDSVTNIKGDSNNTTGGGAFEDCTGLTSVTIGNSVTSIGENTFRYCKSLTKVTIPDSVTTIGGAAFEYCSSLTSVTIGNGVTSIGGNAFKNCKSLTSITIPNSVIKIGDMAFTSCNNLTNVTFQGKVTQLGEYSFSMEGDLRQVYLASGGGSGTYIRFAGGKSWRKQ